MIRSSRSYPRGATPLGLFALALAVVALTSAAPGPVTSTRHSPGWYPNADPESASVRLGRRPDAPLVSLPFSGGERSLDDLGRTVCRLLHHRDQDSLLTLCVTDTEFRTILWREFPQSRPATGLQWEDGWRVLDMRLRSGISDAVGEYGGRVHTFVRFEAPDSVARYRNFRLLSGLVMVVRDDEGRLQRWGWLRAVAERKGRYKLYSLRD